MGLQLPAVLKATGVGIGLYILIFACTLLAQVPAGIPLGTLPTGPTSGWYQLFSCVSSCVLILVYMAGGILYAAFARQGEASVSTGQLVIGGVVTAFGIWVVSICLSIVNFALIWNDLVFLLERELALAGIPSLEGIVPFLVFGGLIGLVIGLALVAAFGAAGGAIGGALFKQDDGTVAAPAS